MTELRWVLLALGALTIVAVYLWGRGLPQRLIAPIAALKKPRRDVESRIEPGLGDAADPETVAESIDEPTDEDAEPEVPETGVRADATTSPESIAESVITLRLIPRARVISCDKVVLALRAAGLRHGRYGIFHMHFSELLDEPMFSVANLTEPGTFDLSKISETTLPGMSFFMILPGSGDPVERFDKMVTTARELARRLDGELHDEKGSSWSIQRERYVREQVIAYRHALDRSTMTDGDH